jgi:uncharacterized protein YcfJ
MKKLAIALGSIATAFAPAAFSQYYGDRNYDRNYDRYNDRTARVIESRPVYDAASGARQECWNPRAGHYEEVRAPEKTNVGKGAAIGAVTGGVLGHQVGSGSGNTAATVGGAVLGGILGHKAEQRHDRDDQGDLDRSRCRIVGDTSSGALLGYDVRYEVDGREYVTRMSREPGSSLELGRDINRDGTPYS